MNTATTPNQTAASFGIHRVTKLGKSDASAMIAHALRTAKPPNADASRTHENTVIAGAETAAQARDIVRLGIETHNQNGRAFRTDGVAALDLFFGASHEAMDSLPRQQQDDYFRRCLEWAVKTYGCGDPSNVITAVVHRDERSPHLQVLIRPLMQNRLRARDIIGTDRKRMEALQDEFHETVSSAFGFGRGKKGSKAKHVPNLELYHRGLKAVEAIRSGKWPAPAPMPEPPEFPRPSRLANLLDYKQKKDAWDEYDRKMREALEQNEQAVVFLRDAAVGFESQPEEMRLRMADELRQKLAEAERELRRAHEENERVQELAEETARQQADAAAEREAASRAKADADRALDDARRDAQTTREQAEKQAQRLVDAEEQRIQRAVDDAVTMATADLRDAEAQAKARESEARSARALADKAQQEAEKAQKEATKAKQAADKAKGDYEARHATVWQKVWGEFNESLTQARNDAQTARDERDTANGKVKQQGDEIASLKRQLETRNGELKQAKGNEVMGIASFVAERLGVPIPKPEDRIAFIERERVKVMEAQSHAETKRQLAEAQRQAQTDAQTINTLTWERDTAQTSATSLQERLEQAADEKRQAVEQATQAERERLHRLARELHGIELEPKPKPPEPERSRPRMRM